MIALFPTLIEGLTCAGVAYLITGMPIELCFTLAYCLANTAASILVPQMLAINEIGYGKAKGIGPTMIAACAFDQIHTIVVFGICRSLAMNKAAIMIGESTSNIGASLIQTNLYIVVGLAIGVFLGLGAYFFESI